MTRRLSQKNSVHQALNSRPKCDDSASIDSTTHQSLEEFAKLNADKPHFDLRLPDFLSNTYQVAQRKVCNFYHIIGQCVDGRSVRCLSYASDNQRNLKP